eukprot:TRINITY_DN2653_c0_g1_i2.p1 TRINITY_DN2653_c0_g1~~TRINITY_DN2653_c0_g1_i2.p1  ORF type:complete len:358 (+),score=94.96 TRINITY_DN2653_c0_g1_i2:50-1075(+)
MSVRTKNFDSVKLLGQWKDSNKISESDFDEFSALLEKDLLKPVKKIMDDDGEQMERGKSGIIMFKHVQGLSPRGRMDIEFCENELILHAKNASYRIEYTRLLRILGTNNPNQAKSAKVKQRLLILHLSSPLLFGRQKLGCIVLQIKENEKIAHEQLQESDRFETEFFNALRSVVPVICKLDNGIQCYTKDIKEGTLFLCGEGALFFQNSCFFIGMDEMQSVLLGRGSIRSLQCIVETKSGEQHSFTQLPMASKGLFDEFLHKQKVYAAKHKQMAKHEEHSEASDDEDGDGDGDSDSDFGAEEAEEKMSDYESDGDIAAEGELIYLLNVFFSQIKCNNNKIY